MRRSRKFGRARGFTMLELAVAMAMTAAIASLSVPHMVKAARLNQLRHMASGVVTDVSLGRNYAASGRRFPDRWSADDRTRSSGLLIASPSSYLLFADRDSTTNGDEVVVKTVVLPLRMTITDPAPGQVMRFRPNGTISNAFNVTVRDEDTGLSRTVIVTSGGYARVN